MSSSLQLALKPSHENCFQIKNPLIKTFDSWNLYGFLKVSLEMAFDVEC